VPVSEAQAAHQLHLLMADPKFQQALSAYRGENDGQDVAFLAGSNKGGNTVAFDRDFAEAIEWGKVRINGRPIDPRPAIRVHESVEGAIVRHQYSPGIWILGKDPDAAHRIALLAERYAAEEMFGAGSWPAYLQATAPWIKQDNAREVPHPPKDILRLPA
jgi:hypothetical protein